MMKMKTLTVNGQTFSVTDGTAVHYDEKQDLTQNEKKQARQNIGAEEAALNILLACELVPAITDSDGAVLAESDGTILLNL